MIRLAVRGHDVAAEDAESLCKALQKLGVRRIQLVAHKSFPDFIYCDEQIGQLAETLRQYDIGVAVYGCYIDPATQEGQARFLQHIRYAAMLGAEMIATETGVGEFCRPLDAQLFDGLTAAFKRFVHEASQYGLRVAVETVGVHPVATPEQTLRLLDAVNGLVAVFDPENLRMQNVANGPDPARKALTLYGEKIAAVHWKHADADKDIFILEWLQRHPQVPLITEGLTGKQLTTLLKKLMIT